MAIQSDETLVTKGDLKTLYTEKILPYLGGNFMLGTNVSDYYSTDEKIVGVWLEGKPLYQKTVNFGALPNATTKNVPHGISNLDYVVEIYGVSSDGSIQAYLPYVNPSSLSNAVSIKINGSNIQIVTASNMSTFTKTYVTLRYTKTTDAANSAVSTPGCYDINFPNTWPENKEIFFGNGVYGYRAVGTANVTANRRWDLVIARDQPNVKIRSQGGGFTTHSNWFCPTPWHYESDGTFQCSTSMIVGNVENTKNVNYYIMS